MLEKPAEVGAQAWACHSRGAHCAHAPRHVRRETTRAGPKYFLAIAVARVQLLHARQSGPCGGLVTWS